MKQSDWRVKIVDACKSAGTYHKCFDDVIDALAQILERRDEANALYKKSGGHAIVQYTNKGGNTNPTKNPALVLWDELNKTALSYWRDLGLTPSGLKRINENAISGKKSSVLAEALKELGEEI